MKKSQDSESAEPRRSCPNCGASVGSEARICPNCGADFLPVWPPPPEGASPVDPKPSRPWEAKEQVNSGAATGCGVGFTIQAIIIFLTLQPLISGLLHVSSSLVLGVLVHGPPIFALVMLYFFMRGGLPFFARGIGYSIVAALVLSLGAVALCHY